MFLSKIAADGGEDSVLRAMFAARKRVFVDLLRWDLPVLAGEYEVDHFDDCHATYLVLSDAQGQHLGSARLLDTRRSHILDTLFPVLCEGCIPRGNRIREITRFCLDPRQNADQRRRIRDTLVHALAEHAIENGIESYTGVAQLSWLKQILEFGWDCRQLGRFERIGRATLGAVHIKITPDTPAKLAAAGLSPSPRLTLRPIPQAA